MSHPRDALAFVPPALVLVALLGVPLAGLAVGAFEGDLIAQVREPAAVTLTQVGVADVTPTIATNDGSGQ